MQPQYYDQEYKNVASSFKRLSENALRLLIISLCVFILANALYIYLNMRRMSPVARSMCLIDASENAVSRQMLASYVLLSGISLLIGTLAGILLYNTASKQLLSTLIDLEPAAVIICAAVQAAALFAAGAPSIRSVAQRRLMQTGRRREKKEVFFSNSRMVEPNVRNAVEELKVGILVQDASYLEMRREMQSNLKLLSFLLPLLTVITGCIGFFASFLTTRGRLLLADEPTGNLDTTNSKNIVETLKELAHKSNCCVIVVTHDSAVAEQADEVLKMRDGLLVFD